MHQSDPPGLKHDDLRLLPPWRGSSLLWGKKFSPPSLQCLAAPVLAPSGELRRFSKCWWSGPARSRAARAIVHSCVSFHKFAIDPGGHGRSAGTVAE